MPTNQPHPAPVPTVTTRLLIPPRPRHLVARGALLDRLDRGVREGLVLLAAPAGAGKTALLSSWIAERELPGRACWLSLDGEHDDPGRLLRDLLGALRGSDPARPRGGPLARLRPPLGARIDRFLALLVNALSELDEELVLVLDDVHELRSREATATLDFLVRHAPAQLRLALAGRADPPLAIERLRVAGALTELRAADLAFDREETAELCRTLGLELSAADVERLWTRTEGWIAALRLAAFSLQGHPEPARFLAEFAGTDRAVADYLVSEVLAGAPPEQREFMLRTSLVDAVDPELAGVLSSHEDAASMLAAIERRGAPVQRASAGECYRYHPLFAELLRAHLRHAHPEELPELHRRAARCYEERAQTMPAIRHALAGGDWERTGALIGESWLELLLRGGSSALRAAMAQLPRAALVADPRLAAAVAGSRLQDGELEEAERHLELARTAIAGRGDADGESLELVVTMVALQAARLRVQPEAAEALAGELTEMARSRTHDRWASLRGFALCQLGAARLWAGDAQGAVTPLQEALALADEQAHEPIALDCLAQLALAHLHAGRLRRAEELSAQAIELAETHGWSDGSAVACAHLAGAAAAYRRGELEAAEGLLAGAAGAARTAEAPVRLATGLLQALTLAAAGPRSAERGVLKLLAIRSELEECSPTPGYLRAALEDVEARVLLAAGERQQAAAALDHALERQPGRPELLLDRARLELSLDTPERAGETLEAVLADEAGLHRATLVEGWLLRALVDRATGDERSAARALDRALAAAEEEPFRDAFLLNGGGVRGLLESQAQAATEHPALLEVLLDAAGDGRHAKLPALAEPLTEREQRILRYLPTMLSNAEIGAEVFVSLNTVKTHLRSIYRKLDAGGRADAVERARGLGLLPTGIKRPRVPQRT
ncbi:MAG TPA: LuxR C-terminal-related transcriptional regulator [Solirubrobacteraceae bacterium]|nr:LuxR C-terminal-related transcriptional regulator [Solirubrobacteraceae bacterium]